MARKIAYWTSTVIVAVMLLFALSYLTGNPQVVSGFAKAGYPPHLRIVLGIAKPAAAIVLLLPGLALLKEWAYAGSAFTWVMAFIAHYSGGDGVQVWAMPLVLLALLIVSYFSRPSNRRMALSPSRA
ncbi:MAG: DoxX family protein [Acidobacteria bacterium]|nr:MAG: DoxX family protein [Acidobacteriota bacterium]PYU95016.1 MAG: DoxX family protein [Acidobacteriota bacterium]